MSHLLIILRWREDYTLETILIRDENNDNKNFIIREKKAYTEDNVLIYNIYVNRIPIQLAEEDVLRYFSKFGKVFEVKFIKYNNRYRLTATKVGFVSFAEPECACRVLRWKKHRLGGSRICVIPAESWNQPNAEKVCCPTKNDDDVPSTSKGSSKEARAINGGTHIFSLNDDCIDTLFGYLELKEQVRFARVCERFQDIFQMHCKRKYKNLALSNIRGLTLWEMRDFFRFAGGNMASITGTWPYKNRERIVEFISTFCGKLNSIRLEDSEMRNKRLMKLLRGCPQLQELTLRNCSLKDNHTKTMTHLNCLETLDLAENYELTGEFISKLVQLKVLNLCGCCNIQHFHLVNICKSLRKLRSLDIRRCDQLSATLFEVMVEHCKELEILKMSCPNCPYERVALLPRLKQLELLHDLAELINDYGALQTSPFAELVAHKSDQLEVLKIVARNTLRGEHIAPISELRQLKTLFIPYNALVNDDALIKFCKLQQLEDLTIKGCSNITNQGLLKLAKSCQRLHHLDIQFCKQITIEFLLETISFLKASEKRKSPIILKARGTGMDYDEVIEYEEFKEAEEQSLISVDFEDLNGAFS